MSRVIRLCLCAVGVIGVGIAYRAAWLPSVANWLDVGVRPRKADYVMVLPGGASTRPLVASAMISRGLALKVLIPTSQISPQAADGLVPQDHELIRRVLNKRGVPDERIEFLGVRSASTWGDAAALREFLVGSSNVSVAVVTNDYHTRRARWVFRRVLGEHVGQILFVSVPTDYVRPDSWWQSRLGLETYCSEYCKFLVYGLRYGDPLVWTFVIVMPVLIIILWLRHRFVSRPATGNST